MPAMQKFNFSIRTRDGQRVLNILIAASEREEAERRLRQMYHHCEILECTESAMDRQKLQQGISVEEIITLISK